VVIMCLLKGLVLLKIVLVCVKNRAILRAHLSRFFGGIRGYEVCNHV